MTHSEMANIHKRTVGAIKSRIKRIAYLLHLNNTSTNEILYKTKLTVNEYRRVIKKYKTEKQTEHPTIDKIVKDKPQKCSMLDIEAFAREIYSQLGPGYSERVYHNAMEVLLREKGIRYESERIIPIPFKGHVIGNLRADIIINNETVLEFKTIKTLNDAAELQGNNYLRLTGLKTAYLVNYPPHPGREVEVRRIQVVPLSGELEPGYDKTFENPGNVSVGLEPPLEEYLEPFGVESELLLDSGVPLGRLD
jgi:GxxExxY protein